MMADGILVSPHIVLSSLVVAIRVVALDFFLWDVVVFCVLSVMGPQMTVKVFEFCASFVGAAFDGFRTFAGSTVIVLVLCQIAFSFKDELSLAFGNSAFELAIDHGKS